MIPRPNPYETRKKQLEIAARLINLNENTIEYLKGADRILVVTIPIIMDDGRLKIFEGYRVHHSILRGPAIGGVRYALDLTLDDIKALAFLMTFKTALLGIPLGGSKGGVRVDVKQLSKKEIEKLTRRYTAEIINMIGPDMDILTPELNTDEQTMAWIMDVYSMQKGKSVPGVVTGKPIEIGGTEGRADASGLGLFFILEAICGKRGLNSKNLKIAIQGFGKLGMVIAKSLYDNDCNILAVSDSTGGIYSEDGLNIDRLIEWKKKGNQISDFKDKNTIKRTNLEVLETKCDVLIPAAIENQITSKNAEKIDCQIILEGADGPVTSQADAILESRGILVVPDILANGGALCVSYFEYIQGLHSYFWKKERVISEMKNILLDAFEKVWAISEEKKVTLRNAAYMIAIERVAKTHELRGLFP
jgi:glutamate dehydrogenase (NAD(P)+)